ncbi:Carbon monoxide dehydrogenase subunit G, CoxG [Halapricum desulfuricans]|uniref:Carbon monoxide dehydrogenase subunit G, CoxG n=1 Tax=Halapricum desulfuricans TaxID=2841257 RepID=A0A897NH86_9EURY|nr:SRPBCC family protein [Halapricum desulfuricans]QSG11958.1 Carbon monoxide dehydrogenase subunit G, CoxG [Halapricum desulfuricans]
MTIRVEREVDVPVPPERVWEYIVEPENRARPISVVTDFDLDDETARKATWHIKLPIPLIDRTIAVETEDVTRDPPKYVKFTGRSKVMRVVGEHELEPTETGTRLTNRFTVEGRVPGVERFFKRNLETEFDNIEDALFDDLGLRL